LRIFDPKRRFIEILTGRLDRLEEETGMVSADATAEEPNPEDSMTPWEKWEYRFNWLVKEILPFYKEEVMRVHNLTSDEYDKRTIDGDETIYLEQPHPRFSSTHYDERVAHVLGLTFREIRDKFERGELEHKIATGGVYGWRDEDPQAVF
jgi:hypothetical protein